MPVQAMDGTTKRLKISDVLANMFRSVLALSPGMFRFICCDCVDLHPPLKSKSRMPQM